MSEVPIEGKVVGQIGEATYYTFSVVDEDLLANLSCAEVTGYSIGPVDVDEVQASRRLGDNYTADLTFKRVYASGRGYGKTQAQREMVADWAESALSIELTPWQRSFMRGVLGSWQETPREELRRRLNISLRGEHPGEPTNWKGLK